MGQWTASGESSLHYSNVTEVTNSIDELQEEWDTDRTYPPPSLHFGQWKGSYSQKGDWFCTGQGRGQGVVPA